MKRAAIIVTDADYVFITEAWTTRTTQEASIDASEQLLEDLWNLVDECEALDIPHLRNAAARVRAAIGDTE